MAAIGSVLAMPAAGWLINKFGGLSIVIGATLGFGLALPLIAESNTVLTVSVAFLFYGAIAGSMDVAMNTHAVMLEKRYRRHSMSSFHALFSLGGMAGSALGGLGCFTCGFVRDSLLGQRYSTCSSVHTRIQVASASLSI